MLKDYFPHPFSPAWFLYEVLTDLVRFEDECHFQEGHTQSPKSDVPTEVVPTLPSGEESVAATARLESERMFDDESNSSPQQATMETPPGDDTLIILSTETGRESEALSRESTSCRGGRRLTRF